MTWKVSSNNVDYWWRNCDLNINQWGPLFIIYYGGQTVTITKTNLWPKHIFRIGLNMNYWGVKDNIVQLCRIIIKVSYYQNYLGQAFLVFFNYLQQSIRDPFIIKRKNEYYKDTFAKIIFENVKSLHSIIFFALQCILHWAVMKIKTCCFQEIPFVLFVPGLIVAQTVVNHSKTFAITYSSRNYVIKVFL